jgi:hypothetical protein
MTTIPSPRRANDRLRTFRLSEPYAPRPIRFLDLWELDGWRLKLYGIAYKRPAPRSELIETARRLARERLPQPPVTNDRYGVGFVGIHDGRGANFVFVDWWAQENELNHHNWSGPSNETRELVPSEGAVLCVWDARVVEFERAAWLETVLTNPTGPDLDAYLARRLSEEA